MRTSSVSKEWAGSGSSRGFSSAQTSATVRSGCSGGEVVVAGELEQAGVELDGGAAPVEDGASDPPSPHGARLPDRGQPPAPPAADHAPRGSGNLGGVRDGESVR